MTITEIIKVMHQESDSDDTSYPAVLVTDIGIIRINSAIETLVSKIIKVADFPFDDENIANIAEGTIDLEEGVSKYTITDRFLTILEVKVKDANGYYSIVKPVTQEEDSSIVESDEALTGLPTKYRMVGRTIFVRVAPTATAVTLTAGLKFAYTRTSYQITTADVAAESLIPGIATPWHPTIAKMAALPYNKTYKKDRVLQLERDILIETKDCLDFYSNRIRSKRHIITPKRIMYI